MLPPKAQCALSFLRYLEGVRNPAVRFMVGRDLTAKEFAANNAALDVLRMWFQGEIELDMPPSEIEELMGTCEDSEDGPDEVLVPKG